MTRSLSFKINGSTKEHVSRNAAKKSLPGPRKLDVDNWFQEKRSTQVKESPPGNLRYVEVLYLNPPKKHTNISSINNTLTLYVAYAPGLFKYHFYVPHKFIK